MRLRWTRAAIEDLDSARAWIAAENGRAAIETVLRIRTAIDGLRRFPNLGRPGRVDGTRELVVTGTPFIVAYRISGTEVTVLNVFHGARQWPDRLDD